MKDYKGYVSNIIFRNDDNGYTVFELVCGNRELTCVGNVITISEGENLRVTGENISHPIYGEQIKVTEIEQIVPEDEESLLRYLGSGAIHGIGEVLAERIVDFFGMQTLYVLENEPERLAQIKGISERKARDIAVQFHDKARARDAFIFLQKYGVSNNMAIRIYDEYGDAVYGIMQENPYKLAEDIRGTGFKTADEIAYRAGIRTDSQYRIRAGIMYELSSAGGEGHMYLPMDELIRRASVLLDIAPEHISTEILNLTMDMKTVIKKRRDRDCVYAAEFYYTELKCAAMLHDLNLSIHSELSDEDKNALDKKIDRLEKELGLEFDELQKEAVRLAATNGLLIISGGPGTGKTTAINALIRYFDDEGMDIMLAAPTGRAAKRMTEATGYEARTIHRLLELSGAPDDDKARARFERNESNPLECDVLILDEMSMVDVFLFNSLLKAVSPGTRLIMVGDVDQLPSVGPGQVLKDLIASEAFPVVMLMHIFRQAEGSDIVVGAHEIRSGRYPKLDNESSDLFFLSRNDVNVIYKHMIQLITEKLPGYVSADPMDIQVLTPMRKGSLGAETLNRILQRFLNPESPEKKEVEYGSYIFREGDKVMQIKNNYRLEWTVTGAYNIAIASGTGVFNGDMGHIDSIDENARLMRVVFDENRIVEYDFTLLEELEPAYCVTIHKSQGSEYPAVIIPLLSGPRQLFTRNLLYTALTRAKHCAVIMGLEETVRGMVDNDQENMRYSGLENCIREVCD